MDLGSFLDSLFVILAFLIIPLTWYTAPEITHTTSSQPQFLSVHSPSAHNTPVGSPMTSPKLSEMMIPTITLTPDRFEPVRGARPSHGSAHKRKSVSFSLSSMDEVNPPNIHANKKRPPTPFVKGPASPNVAASKESSANASPASSAPASPVPPIPVLGHNTQIVDSMGVKKQWLMA